MKLVYTWVKICMYTYIENQRGALHTHTNTYPNREQHLVQLRGDQYDDGRSNVTQFFVYVQKKEWKSENASEHLLVSIWWAIISSLHCVCVCVCGFQWRKQFTALWKQQIKVANSLLPRTDRKCMQTWLVIDFGMGFIVEGITICVTCHSFFSCSINAMWRK